MWSMYPQRSAIKQVFVDSHRTEVGTGDNCDTRQSYSSVLTCAFSKERRPARNAPQAKGIPSHYATRSAIAVFTTARHWSQSSARQIQFSPPHHNSLGSIVEPFSPSTPSTEQVGSAITLMNFIQDMPGSKLAQNAA
jgi:hypothetical protein